MGHDSIPSWPKKLSICIPLPSMCAILSPKLQKMFLQSVERRWEHSSEHSPPTLADFQKVEAVSFWFDFFAKSIIHYHHRYFKWQPIQHSQTLLFNSHEHICRRFSSSQKRWCSSSPCNWLPHEKTTPFSYEDNHHVSLTNITLFFILLGKSPIFVNAGFVSSCFVEGSTFRLGKEPTARCVCNMFQSQIFWSQKVRPFFILPAAHRVSHAPKGWFVRQPRTRALGLVWGKIWRFQQRILWSYV